MLCYALRATHQNRILDSERAGALERLPKNDAYVYGTTLALHIGFFGRFHLGQLVANYRRHGERRVAVFLRIYLCACLEQAVNGCCSTTAEVAVDAVADCRFGGL